MNDCLRDPIFSRKLVWVLVCLMVCSLACLLAKLLASLLASLLACKLVDLLGCLVVCFLVCVFACSFAFVFACLPTACLHDWSCVYAGLCKYMFLRYAGLRFNFRFRTVTQQLMSVSLQCLFASTPACLHAYFFAWLHASILARLMFCATLFACVFPCLLHVCMLACWRAETCKVRLLPMERFLQMSTFQW